MNRDQLLKKLRAARDAAAAIGDNAEALILNDRIKNLKDGAPSVMVTADAEPMTDEQGFPLNPELEARRRLRDAAPDMLAALKSCDCPGGGWNGQPKDTIPTVEDCVAYGQCGCTQGDAVKKAEGRDV